MKKHLLLFLALTGIAMADVEVRVSGNLMTKGKVKTEIPGDRVLNKDIFKNGFGVSLQATGNIADAEIGFGTGLKYDTLKSIKNSRTSGSKNVISVPFYFVGKPVFDTPNENLKVYMRYELGLALRTGNLKWSNQQSSGEIKFGGGAHAGIGVGVVYKRFITDLSFNWDGMRVKRSYRTATSDYGDKITMKQSALTLSLGYVLKEY